MATTSDAAGTKPKPCIVWDNINSLTKLFRGDITQTIGVTAALAEQGIDVSLVALNVDGKIIQGAEVIQVPGLWYIKQRTRLLGRIWPRQYGYESHGMARSVAKYAASIAGRKRFDLFHVRNPYLSIQLKKYRPDTPIVYTVIPRYFHSRTDYDREIDQKAIDAADILVTLTNGWRDYVIDTFDLGGRGVSVIPVCTKPKNTLGVPDDLPNHFAHRKLIGYFGRLQETYGIDTLIEILPELKKRVDNFGVIIAGAAIKKNYERHLKRLVHQLELNDLVYFAGQIPHHAVPRYIQRCHVLISLRHDTVRHRYGFDVSIPIKCVEYIMQGKPVLATRDGGMELLLGRNNPYLVEPGDREQMVSSLERLLSDDDEAVRVGKLNSRISMEYTYEAVAGKLIQVYRQLV